MTKETIAEVYRNIGVIEGVAMLMEEEFAQILSGCTDSIRELLDMEIQEEKA